jgi:hypothetical protein
MLKQSDVKVARKTFFTIFTFKSKLASSFRDPFVRLIKGLPNIA